MSKHSADIIFKSWLGYLLKEQPSDRYAEAMRVSHLEQLFLAFKNQGISMDDAEMFRNKAMIALTTEEGRKGKDKYKGWKEKALYDYDAICALAYSREELGFDGSPVNMGEKVNNDVNIESWAKEKYGLSANHLKHIIEQAHIIGNMYQIQYINDRFVV